MKAIDNRRINGRDHISFSKMLEDYESLTSMGYNFFFEKFEIPSAPAPYVAALKISLTL